MEAKDVNVRRTEGNVGLVGSNQDAQAWLEANTFYCETLHARITSQQCAENRRKAKHADFDGYKGPPQCLSCNKWQEEEQMKCQVCGESKLPTEFPKVSNTKRSKVCEVCTETKVQLEQLEQLEQPQPEQTEESIERARGYTKKKRTITCPECGRVRPNHARGICAMCYSRLQQDGTLDQRYPAQLNQQRTAPNRRQQVDVKNIQIKLDFPGADKVTQALQQQAEQELRTLEAQAAWVLLQWAEGQNAE